MSLQGELLNHNFIAAGAGEEDKDHLQLNRRRFVFLLHDRIVTQERIRVENSKSKKRKKALANNDEEDEVNLAVVVNPEDVILNKKSRALVGLELFTTTLRAFTVTSKTNRKN